MYVEEPRGIATRIEMEAIKEQRQRMRELAQAIVSGDAHPIFAIREICSIAHRTGQQDLDFIRGLRAIESETDFYPRAEKRHLYSRELLSKWDAEVESHIFKVKACLLADCSAIIRDINQSDCWTSTAPGP